MTPADLLEAMAKAICQRDEEFWAQCHGDSVSPDAWSDQAPVDQDRWYAVAAAALTLALGAAAEEARTFEMVPRLRRAERVVARAIADEIDALKPNA